MPPSFAFTTPLPLHPPTPRATQQSLSYLHVTPLCSTTPPPRTRDPSPSPSLATAPLTKSRFVIPFFTFLWDIATINENTPLVSSRLGSVYQGRDVLHRPMIVVSDMAAMSAIYRDNKRFTSRASYPKSFGDMFGSDTLFLLDGKEHAVKRAKVQVALVGKVIEEYYKVIGEMTAEFWEQVAEEVERKGRVRFSDMVKEHMLKVTIRLTAGTEVMGREKEMMQWFMHMAGGLMSIPGGLTYRKAKRARDKLLALFEELITDRRQNRNGTGSEKMDMKSVKSGEVDLLTFLSTEGEVDEVARLVMLIWFAGFSTQSSVLTCAVAKMTDDIKQELMEEQNLLTARYGNNVGPANIRKGCMPKLEAYLNEIMRLYPPAVAIFRRAVDDTEVLGHEVKAGTMVLLDLWSGMKSEDNFENAKELKLDRFLEEGPEKVIPENFAFGVAGGPHFCLGAGLAKLQMVCLMSEMLKSWNVELKRNQDLVVKMFPEVTPGGGCVIAKCEKKKMSKEKMLLKMKYRK